MTTIIFNGKTYNSMDEMSATDRQAFEQLSNLFVDKNGNGIPDFLEGDVVKNVTTAYTSIVDINGKKFNTMNGMPEDMRTKVQSAFEKMAELGIVTKTSSPMMVQASNIQAGQSPQITSTPPVISQEYPTTIQEGSGPSILQWALLGIFLFFCVLIAALGVFYFMQ